MNNKSRHGLWLVVGAYLGYTGFSLIKSIIEEKANMLYIIPGIIFIGVAVWVVIRSIKGMRAPEPEEAEADETEVDETEVIEEIEAADDTEAVDETGAADETEAEEADQKESGK